MNLLRTPLLISLGAILGANARYFLSIKLASDNGFPWPTFLVNIVGSLLLGLLMGQFVHPHQASANTLRLLLGIGFCGSFTTFSALSWELFSMLRAHHNALALTYLSASVIVGVVCIAAGYCFAMRLL